MGGADLETLNKLERFSHFAGIAYQIRDDMEDFDGQRGDIRFRKPSVQLAMLMKQLPDEERPVVEQAFIEGDFTMICHYLENYNTNESCLCLLKENLDHAKESLENLGNIGLKLALHEILGKIFDKYL